MLTIPTALSTRSDIDEHVGLRFFFFLTLFSIVKSIKCRHESSLNNIICNIPEIRRINEQTRKSKVKLYQLYCIYDRVIVNHK